jgi:hypothetical protein
MHEAPRFTPGDPVRDIQAHDEIGRVETVRSDGHVNVRWKSGKTEWVAADSIELAPGFKPTRRRR